MKVSRCFKYKHNGCSENPYFLPSSSLVVWARGGGRWAWKVWSGPRHYWHWEQFFLTSTVDYVVLEIQKPHFFKVQII